MLRRIVFSPFDFITLAAAVPELDGVWADDDPQPFLVLYQHGKSVWAGPPETQASSTARRPQMYLLKQSTQFLVLFSALQKLLKLTWNAPRIIVDKPGSTIAML